jgi:hypothetical protein
MCKVFDFSWQDPSRSEGVGNLQVTTKRAVGTKALVSGPVPTVPSLSVRALTRHLGLRGQDHLNNNPLNASKFRRHTIHVCIPGVSTSTL